MIGGVIFNETAHRFYLILDWHRYGNYAFYKTWITRPLHHYLLPCPWL